MRDDRGNVDAPLNFHFQYLQQRRDRERRKPLHVSQRMPRPAVDDIQFPCPDSRSFVTHPTAIRDQGHHRCRHTDWHDNGSNHTQLSTQDDALHADDILVEGWTRTQAAVFMPPPSGSPEATQVPLSSYDAARYFTRPGSSRGRPSRGHERDRGTYDARRSTT